MSKVKVFININSDCIEKYSSENLVQLQEMLDAITQEDNTDLFLDTDIDLSDEEILTTYFVNDISLIAQVIIQAENWKDKPVLELKEGVKFHEWKTGHSTPASNLLAEMAERQLIYEEYCLLITCCLDKTHTNQAYIIKDNPVFPAKSHWITIAQIDCLNIPQFNTWLNQFKTNRIFRHNPKHDKVKKKNNKGEDVAVLLCSDERATELLESAINSPKSESGKLYNFDETEGFYIVFMHEEYKPNIDASVYHAFHREDTDKFLDEIKNQDNELYKKLILMKE